MAWSPDRRALDPIFLNALTLDEAKQKANDLWQEAYPKWEKQIFIYEKEPFYRAHLLVADNFKQFAKGVNYPWQKKYA